MAAQGSKTARPASPVAPVAGQKRKRPTEKKFYAVRVGRTPGVYDTWQQCLQQVTGQKGASFKSFFNADDAQAFVEGKVVPDANKPPGEQKFYAVQAGKVPGVYTDWPTAQQQISGFKNPRHKKFPTRAEAEAFVNEGKARSPYDGGNGISPEEEIRRLIVKQSVPGMVDDSDYVAKDKNGQAFELGRGPLPPGAEDGFDPNIKLEPDGSIRHRTLEEKSMTKTIPKESDASTMLKIYTDGSSLSNGQVGARAGVGVYFGPAPFEYDSHSSLTSPNAATASTTSSSTKSEVPLFTIDWRARGAPSNKKKRKLTWRYRNISEALKGTKQTNQRAELTAIQRALEIAPAHRDVTIFTDSRYSIDCVTNWYKNWQKNGWLNSRGKAVENKDIVQEIRERINERDSFERQTLFVWVKGHSTDKGNIEADRLAVEGAHKGLDEDTHIPHTDNDGTAEEDGSVTDESDESQDLDDPEAEAAFQLRKEALNGDESMMSS